MRLRERFSYTREICGEGALRLPVPNIADAVSEVAIAPGTPGSRRYPGFRTGASELLPPAKPEANLPHTRTRED